MYRTTTLRGKVTFIYLSQNLALVSILLDFLVECFLIRYQQKFKGQNHFLLLSLLLNPTCFLFFFVFLTLLVCINYFFNSA